MVNKHDGEKFLVLGQGPSLDLYPKSFYEEWEGVTIGINRIKTFHVPDYWIALDVMGNRIEKCATQQWYEFQGCDRNEWGPRDGFIEKSSGSISRAIACAYHLGASELYLIGVDCCKSPDGKNHYEKRESYDYDDRNEKDDWFLDMLPKRLEELFKCYEDQGVKSYDLCPWGRLTGIKKMDLRNKEI